MGLLLGAAVGAEEVGVVGGEDQPEGHRQEPARASLALHNLPAHSARKTQFPSLLTFPYWRRLTPATSSPQVSAVRVLPSPGRPLEPDGGQPR